MTRFESPCYLLPRYSFQVQLCLFGPFRFKSINIKVNIDELAEKENFEMKRSYMQDNKIISDVITCRIVGIKKPQTANVLPRPQFDGSENDVQWVEISGYQ